MLKLMADESLQSWVYRCLVVHGVKELSSVIADNGKWRELPFLLNEHRSFIFFHDDVDTLQLFLASSIRMKGEMFPKPWEFVDEMAKYIKHETHRLNNTTTKPIRYCPYCINDSIRENGFGYFKAGWLEREYCKEHSCNLVHEKVTTRKAGVSLLEKASKGDLACEMDRSDSTNFLVKEKISLEAFFSEKYLMPCFLMDFYWSASFKKGTEFSEDVSYVFFNQNGSRKSLKHFYNRGEADTVHFVKSKLYEIKRLFPDELQRYFSNKSELAFYKYGISEKESFCSTLVVSKKTNCSKCIIGSRENMCPSNLMIKVFKVGLESQPGLQEMNICDRYIYGDIQGY